MVTAKPRQPAEIGDIAGDPWRRYGAVLYIPAAGRCSLDAAWAGGGWHVVFLFTSCSHTARMLAPST